ncbi:unnamed protein product [Schistosoma mattheei]|uniref:Uncharacterized protein n=1 Tax=Schistosoma mattheei TaxID=31246 RepID=A0A183Q7U8_9TREM|nr:unnamed protein product [Schistosoma mattheei]
MKRGYHCLLDIGPTAIERLALLGIPPIVILINPSSEYQLKVLLKHYWQFNKTSSALFIPSRVSSRTRPTIKEMVTTLWNSVIYLRQYKSHVITDTVPLLNITSKENSFSEIEWLRNLSEVIRHQQNSPVIRNFVFIYLRLQLLRHFIIVKEIFLFTTSFPNHSK